MPILLITRPAADADHFARGLRRPGLEIVLSPVQDIRPTGIDAPPSEGRRLIFTSRNAVRHVSLPPGQDAICVGQRTTELARSLGMSAQCGGETATALVQTLLHTSETERYLWVRGAHVAHPLGDELRAAGRDCVDWIVYEQHAVALTAAAKRALSGDVPVLVPLFSPRSARLFFDQIDERQLRAPLIVVAMSPAVARHVPHHTALRQVIVAQRPDAASMSDALVAVLENRQLLEG